MTINLNKATYAILNVVENYGGIAEWNYIQGSANLSLNMFPSNIGFSNHEETKVLLIEHGFQCDNKAHLKVTIKDVHNNILKEEYWIFEGAEFSEYKLSLPHTKDVNGESLLNPAAENVQQQILSDLAHK